LCVQSRTGPQAACAESREESGPQLQLVPQSLVPETWDPTNWDWTELPAASPSTG
jgi:hypothetical protein